MITMLFYFATRSDAKCMLKMVGEVNTPVFFFCHTCSLVGLE